MVKRKASQLTAEADATDLRRSTRRKPSASGSATAVADKISTRSNAPQVPLSGQKTAGKKKAAKQFPELTKAKTKAKAKNITQPSTTPKSKADETPNSSGKSYWLMKAEPNSRFENGVNVKFSIDDLASRIEPEPWDGIRNYAARNNLREMKEGDISFFYHSNCKEPGLVGTMEVVQEHSPDLSAHDPTAPYYDPSSKPDNPKWSVVHIKFRSKFKNSIGLKELREMGQSGQPLENMQMLKQSRLSVSRVSATEFEYLMSVVEQQGGETY
ncbi:PUA-like domain-containing protein [Hypoxylon sp. NC1633]|nr:PUA-like domain-containing protein [Hypoxylon sp. NC1633]